MKAGSKKKSISVEGKSDEPKVSLFAVNGNSRESRRARIEAVAMLEPSLGFLAAVFDFEWMVRRAILALSACPTPFIRSFFEKKHGWNSYKEAWSVFVMGGKNRSGQKLEDILTQKANINNQTISDAFGLRHPLVHGANGFIPDDVARHNMDLLLTASDALERHLSENEQTAFKTLKRLKCPNSTVCAYGVRKESRKKRRKLEKHLQEQMLATKAAKN